MKQLRATLVQKASLSMQRDLPTIRTVETDAERHKVRQFWYDVYVHELKRTQNYADHSTRTVLDPLESTGRVLAAWDGDNVVGTIRINCVCDGSLDEYIGLYANANEVQLKSESAGIVTRLMVAKQFRGTQLGLGLAIAMYEVGLRNQLTHIYIDCNSYLVPYFVKLGFIRLGQVVHPEYGQVEIMKISLLDVRHLQVCGSPLADSLLEFKQSNAEGKFK